MNREQAENLKKVIETEIGKTQIKIVDFTEMSKPVSPENAIGRISRMDAINNKSVAEAALAQAKRKLRNLEFALSRVFDADFGSCARCKNDIPAGRLLIMPHSRFCVNCAR
jgi:DnaK suppressor protein